jgi:hypothetical protein
MLRWRSPSITVVPIGTPSAKAHLRDNPPRRVTPRRTFTDATRLPSSAPSGSSAAADRLATSDGAHGGAR